VLQPAAAQEEWSLKPKSWQIVSIKLEVKTKERNIVAYLRRVIRTSQRKIHILIFTFFM